MLLKRLVLASVHYHERLSWYTTVYSYHLRVSNHVPPIYLVPESVVKSTFLTDNNAAILNDNRNDTCITIPPLSQQPGIMNMRLQHLYGAPGTHQVKLHVLNWQCQPNIMFVPDKVTYREQDNFTGLFNRCAFRWQVANTDGISTCLYQCPCSFADCRFIFLRTFEVVEINDAWQLCEIEH